jgi:hypothetical protein
VVPANVPIGMPVAARASSDIVFENLLSSVVVGGLLIGSVFIPFTPLLGIRPVEVPERSNIYRYAMYLAYSERQRTTIYPYWRSLVFMAVRCRSFRMSTLSFAMAFANEWSGKLSNRVLHLHRLAI